MELYRTGTRSVEEGIRTVPTLESMINSDQNGSPASSTEQITERK